MIAFVVTTSDDVSPGCAGSETHFYCAAVDNDVDEADPPRPTAEAAACAQRERASDVWWRATSRTDLHATSFQPQARWPWLVL
jgi:hypothetical protein